MQLQSISFAKSCHVHHFLKLNRLITEKVQGVNNLYLI